MKIKYPWSYYLKISGHFLSSLADGVVMFGFILLIVALATQSLESVQDTKVIDLFCWAYPFCFLSLFLYRIQKTKEKYLSGPLELSE